MRERERERVRVRVNIDVSEQHFVLQLSFGIKTVL